jgi:hypothetical protein
MAAMRLGVPAGCATTMARAQLSAKRAAVSAGGRASLLQGLTRKACPRRALTCAKSTKDVEPKAEISEDEKVADAIARREAREDGIVVDGGFQRHCLWGLMVTYGVCTMQQPDLDLSGTAKRSRAAKGSKKDLSIQDVNPVALGQRSRQFFNEVWRGVNNIGGIARRSASFPVIC